MYRIWYSVFSCEGICITAFSFSFLFFLHLTQKNCPNLTMKKKYFSLYGINISLLLLCFFLCKWLIFPFCFLKAGSGYLLGKHILTAVAKPETNEEVLFNEAHAKMLSVMQETLDLLKRRFRCLMQLGFTEEGSLNKKLNTIKACSVLHNIALKFSVPPPARAGKAESLYSGKQLTAETSSDALMARKELIKKNFSEPRSQDFLW